MDEITLYVGEFALAVLRRRCRCMCELGGAALNLIFGGSAKDTAEGALSVVTGECHRVTLELRI